MSIGDDTVEFISEKEWNSEGRYRRFQSKSSPRAEINVRKDDVRQEIYLRAGN
jgi:hypothetical protein